MEQELEGDPNKHDSSDYFSTKVQQELNCHKIWGMRKSLGRSIVGFATCNMLLFIRYFLTRKYLN